MTHRLITIAKKKLTTFSRDEGGVFAIIFALMALVLVALGGSVVDYVLLESRRNMVQISLDTAALALQERIRTSTPEQIRVLAQDYMDSQTIVREFTANVNEALVDLNSGTLRLTANFEMDTIFVTLVGVHTLGASMEAEVTRRATR